MKLNRRWNIQISEHRDPIIIVRGISFSWARIVYRCIYFIPFPRPITEAIRHLPLSLVEPIRPSRPCVRRRHSIQPSIHRFIFPAVLFSVHLSVQSDVCTVWFSWKSVHSLLNDVGSANEANNIPPTTITALRLRSCPLKMER